MEKRKITYEEYISLGFTFYCFCGLEINQNCKEVTNLHKHFKTIEEIDRFSKFNISDDFIRKMKEVLIECGECTYAANILSIHHDIKFDSKDDSTSV